MFDVIVVGAGPAGSMAAKKCAELGLKTLLLESKALPRDKVCSGMVMAPMAQEIVAQEFGTIPRQVLTTPSCLLGCLLYAPGVEPQVVTQKMPFAWRRQLDFWMTQKAKEAGAEVRDEAKVTSVEQLGETCRVSLNKERFEARFIIGADGTKSTVRKLLYPRLEVQYRIAYRECYRGELALERDYYHWFYPVTHSYPRFDVSYKEEFFILEGNLKKLRSEVPQFLRPYGFSEEQKPLWKDGCLSRAYIGGGLPAGSFIPAHGNVLLVGDAALLQVPVSGEGIGTALKSGLIAARSVAEALASKRHAAEIYLRQLEPIWNILQEFIRWEEKIESEGEKGHRAFITTVANGLRATLRVADFA